MLKFLKNGKRNIYKQKLVFYANSLKNLTVLNILTDNKKKSFDEEKTHDSCTLEEAERIYFENNGKLTKKKEKKLNHFNIQNRCVTID